MTDSEDRQDDGEGRGVELGDATIEELVVETVCVCVCVRACVCVCEHVCVVRVYACIYEC